MTKYAYSKELKKPLSVTNYDIKELVLSGKMATSIKLMSFPVRHYKTKDVRMERKQYSSSDGRQISFFEITPLERKEKYPAIIYYHGGGFVFPIQKPMMNNSCLFAKNCGVKVFLPEYRYLNTVSTDRMWDDCSEMLAYVFEHAEELQVDPDRVIVYGDSAGGCLAAGTVIRNRDTVQYPLRGQMLIYPVCDDRFERYGSVEDYRDAAWSKRANVSMWELYHYDCGKQAEELIPMHCSCHELPKAYVEVLEMDVLRDEAIAYAGRMKAAGVPVECNLISGAFHGYDAQLKSMLVKSVFEHRYQVIREFLE